MDGMNDCKSWAQGSKCYEKLKVVVDVKDSKSCAQGFKCYEQLKVLD